MDSLSSVLSAISHPSRRAIIARLSSGPARVTEIAEPFDVSLNAVSKHLKVLEQARLIRRKRQGRDHVIELDGAPLREAAGWLHGYERFWSRHLDRMEAHYAERSKRRC